MRHHLQYYIGRVADGELKCEFGPFPDPSTDHVETCFRQSLGRLLICKLMPEDIIIYVDHFDSASGVYRLSPEHERFGITKHGMDIAPSHYYKVLTEVSHTTRAVHRDMLQLSKKLEPLLDINTPPASEENKPTCSATTEPTNQPIVSEAAEAEDSSNDLSFSIKIANKCFNELNLPVSYTNKYNNKNVKVSVIRSIKGFVFLLANGQSIDSVEFPHFVDNRLIRKMVDEEYLLVCYGDPDDFDLVCISPSLFAKAFMPIPGIENNPTINWFGAYSLMLFGNRFMRRAIHRPDLYVFTDIGGRILYGDQYGVYAYTPSGTDRNAQDWIDVTHDRAFGYGIPMAYSDALLALRAGEKIAQLKWSDQAYLSYIPEIDGVPQNSISKFTRSCPNQPSVATVKPYNVLDEDSHVTEWYAVEACF